jgi:hypothetical protein
MVVVELQKYTLRHQEIVEVRRGESECPGIFYWKKRTE